MKSVFEASTALDAHMILNLLTQEDIHGQIEGEYLPGGVGDLQAINVVRVVVTAGDYAAAKTIIDDWEAIQPEPTLAEKPALRPSTGAEKFFIGFVVGVAITYWIYH
ncbi:MAG TPA: DUF2007 domain-containing protein [Chromatiaceae bacterium]|jgi:hypothetical protein|nr:DUF2007 domain-containing protein [Chromatiaceae bacterium]HIB84935.1 DUF2007 domain-containing protein [Chromatiaceae bacterium]HIN82961.1 DUF2007 domain-containing protein [Chromatiales bacterium]HIO14224.1 DUF2007 domain-containing protein [Chromatiales bacterium]HIO54582.1 DUF2007 domain-containing protein [Chromatiales bacterium]